MTRAKSIQKRPRNVPLPRPSESRSANEVSEVELRKTGIRVLGDMPWGTHICVFYETKQDLLDADVCYFEAGLKANELCVWAVSEAITEEDAKASLRASVPNFDQNLAAGHIEILNGHEWYLKGDEFDLQRITGGWHEKLHAALAKGYEGIRVSGNAFWLETNHWKEFCEYEHELDHSLAGQKMIVMCTYSLKATRAVDILDVVRAHQFSIARRSGRWEFLQTPELQQAKEEIKRLNGALDVLSKTFPGHQSLTPQERVVLAQIVRGASSKEAGRMLGVSPRTIEFHRANIMHKLDAKNTADLVRKVLSQ